MKRLTIILLEMAFFLPIMACTSENETEQSRNVPIGSASGVKTAVIYFSCTNNTKNIAQKITSVLNCDTWRIEPSEPYTSADLNYNTDCRANREQNDASARPKIKNTIDIAEYDVLYVGFPLWWGKLPKIMWTFFETYTLSGKTIIPFCTSGSSSISTAMSEIRSLEPLATIIDGRRFDSTASEQTVKTWVDEVQPTITMTPIISTISTNKMNISVNGHTLSATLVENSSTAALIELLKKGPITISMRDYASFEKVGSLPQSLPTNDEDITTQAGDLILYLGSAFVIYYDTNSWNFTRLGRIDNISQSELKSILGTDNVSVTLSLSVASSIQTIKSDNSNNKSYLINGSLATEFDKGVIVQNGKKILRR